MKVLGIKSKLLLTFIVVLAVITGLNVGLATYLIQQQSEREAFASLIRQTDLLENELNETVISLREIAKKNVSGNHNLSDLATLYAKTQHLIRYPEQAAQYERGLLFNKIISLNRLQVVLRTADFSSAAVYIDNRLSHYLTTTEAGMNTISVDGIAQFKISKNESGDIPFDNWPNWNEGNPTALVTRHISPVNRTTISFNFSSNQRMVLVIVVPVQATTRSVMRGNITLGSPEGLQVDDLSIAEPDTLNQQFSGQNQPSVIGAFVFRKIFDRAFLNEIANKTGLLPALYSFDGRHQIQVTDMQMQALDIARWALETQASHNQKIYKQLRELNHGSYYQTLALWRFEKEPRLVISFAQSAASTSHKVREAIIWVVGVAGIVLLAGGALGYFLFDRLVKPIRALTEAVQGFDLNIQQDKSGQSARPIASDKLIEINLHVHDEVGQLASAFNAMSQQLRQSFETMEQRVVERTRELQLAKEQAESANRAKSVFLANMSHELRTPLNAVLGFSQVMRNSSDVSPGQIESLNIIIRSGEHLLNLINNVLDISKIESGRVELEEAPVHLYQFLEEIKSLMYVRTHEKGLILTLDQSPDLPAHVIADAGKLRQILINLIGNAIKYTPSGSVIIRAMVSEMRESEPVWLRFEIEDTGPGMLEKDRERIFIPFEQLEERPATEAGTGLGLAICKQFVELMGGTIGVSSETGQGSIFYFEIPLEVIEAVDSSIEPQYGRIIGLAEGQPVKRLLIVDDQPESRQLLNKMLAPIGFELREAVNGREAVDLFAQWHPHLIFMDIGMPIMGGLEATRRIKSTTEGAHTKIVALTAHALEEERRTILAAGCDDFIRKPYRYSEIFSALAAHLETVFIYEDGNSQYPGSSHQLTADDLAELPAELKNRLNEAVVLLDSDAVKHAIEAIRVCRPDIAEQLAEKAKDLRYDIILKLILSAHNNVRTGDKAPF